MGDIALTIGVALGTAAIGLLTGRIVRIIAARFCPQPGFPYATEITTAAVFGLLGWKIGLDHLLPAYLYAASTGVALSLIDLRTRRLPDALTMPSYVTLLTLVAIGAITSKEGRFLVGMLLGTLAAFLLYWGFHRINTALGAGDVKASGLVGGVLGTLGVNAWILGSGVGLVLAALYAVVMLVSGKGTRSTLMPYGPFMFAGCLVGILTA
ncbi:prepilin peptidase [Sphaerimonospora sp. CA-214678]|uniref:prepilin peptidase n=1 Tax=Sphaerimonospora sp. CA-214678 TaxID=3240029 RepID=UPI003D9179C7